jgi:hypothetical protein
MLIFAVVQQAQAVWRNAGCRPQKILADFHADSPAQTIATPHFAKPPGVCRQFLEMTDNKQ